jgi:signal transduction histidine kinase
MFTLIPVPIAVVDHRGTVVIANSCFNEVFAGVSSITSIPEHEVEVPGVGTFQLQTVPLNDLGFRIVYGSDVSSELQLRRQVRHLEKMAAVGRVVTDVAQELCGPLADIAGCASRLRSAEDLPPATREVAERALARTERAGAVIQSLLVLAGAGTRKSTEIDVNALVRSTLERHAGGTEIRNCDVFLDLDEHLPRAHGDSSQIEQVVESLLLRAEGTVSVPRKRRVIQVQTRFADGSIQLHITDNGSSEDGFELQNGIGLNVCAEIVRDHGGELYAWRKNGTGSTLTMELPVVTGHSTGRTGGRDQRRS